MPAKPIRATRQSPAASTRRCGPRPRRRARPQGSGEHELFNQKGAKAFEAGPLHATELAATRPNAVPV